MTQSATDNGTPKPAQSRALATQADIEASHAIHPFSTVANFEGAQRMAKALSKSTIVPEMYRGEDGLGNCMIAMEMASRIGASVLAVMQSLYIVHGRPGWEAKFLIGTVNTCGRFTPIRFRFSGTPHTDDWTCEAYATDKASGEELVGTPISVAMAKAVGWWTKKDSLWPKMTEQFLRYRSATFWTRAYAPELSLGMHTADEIADGYVPESILPAGIAPGNPRDLERAIHVSAEVVDKRVPTPAEGTPATPGVSGFERDIAAAIARATTPGEVLAITQQIEAQANPDEKKRLWKLAEEWRKPEAPAEREPGQD